jgi:hypothetical protein
MILVQGKNVESYYICPFRDNVIPHFEAFLFLLHQSHISCQLASTIAFRVLGLKVFAVVISVFALNVECAPHVSSYRQCAQPKQLQRGYKIRIDHQKCKRIGKTKKMRNELVGICTIHTLCSASVK